MKKLLAGLGLVTMLVGCASRDDNNGMGGTSDQSTKTDSINNSSDQYNNNATHGTGATTATNNATDSAMPQQ
jgi:hypothetical protein